jgi:N-acetylglucosaminyldiphosphoundecaprenol N-acetyl-beta-D-mannosaminyltransferase
MNASPNSLQPRTVPLLGTPLVITDYQGLLDMLPDFARRPETTAIDFCNTQIVSMRRTNPPFRQASQAFDYFLPDGMPLVWCLRAIGVAIRDRVYGPTFMRHALSHETRLTHYFLGGSETTLPRLIEQSRALGRGRFRLVGSHGGYFPLWRRGEIGRAPAANSAILEEINRLSPDVIWIGLGTPKQQQWVHDHRRLIARGVLLTVGFAFDVNAGTKRDAPPWMQKLGLTWIFRISQEPGRLLGRYFKYNIAFVALLLLDLARHVFPSSRRRPSQAP